MSRWKLQKNMGKRDRWFRFAIGLSCLGLAYWKMSWVLLIAALFIFFESLMSWCIFYQFIGKNTCPTKRPKK